MRTVCCAALDKDATPRKTTDHSSPRGVPLEWLFPQAHGRARPIHLRRIGERTGGEGLGLFDSVKLEPPTWAAQAAALAALFENPIVITDLESKIVAPSAQPLTGIEPAPVGERFD